MKRFIKSPRLLLGTLVALSGLFALAALSSGAILIPGDTNADLVLGQEDFGHAGVNFVDPHGFNLPWAVAVDTSTTPHRLYVVDQDNNRVLSFPDAEGFGNGDPATVELGQPDLLSYFPNQNSAFPNGDGRLRQTIPAIPAGLWAPSGVAVDAQGDVYVADTLNNRVLMFPAPIVNGEAATVALGQPDLITNTCVSPTAASLCGPQGVAIDSLGGVWVSDTANSRIVYYGTPSTGAVAALVIGQPDAVSSDCNNPSISGLTLCNPGGLGFDGTGALWTADTGNSRVLRYSNLGANPVTADVVIGQPDFVSSDCNQNGGTSDQTLCFPQDVKVDNNGNIYVADNGNNRVTQYNLAATPTPVMQRLNANAMPLDLTPTPTPAAPTSTPTPIINPGISLVFGQDSVSGGNCINGAGANSLCGPTGVAVDGPSLLIADSSNNRVFEFDDPLMNGTTADGVLGQADFDLIGVDMVKNSGFDLPAAVALDRSVNPPRVYVTDGANNRVLGYASAAALATGSLPDLVIGQPDFFSYVCNDGAGSALTDPGGLCAPAGLAVDANGNLYVADAGNDRVVEFDSPFTKDTFADRVYGQNGDMFTNLCNLGAASPTADTLCSPAGVAIDAAGNLWISDSSNNRVVEFNTPLTNMTADMVFGQDGVPTTGDCNLGNSPGPDTLCNPLAVSLDSGGNLYIADSDNNRVLEFDQPLAHGSILADRVFGQGDSMFTSDCNAGGINGGSTYDSLCEPTAAALDSSSNLYVVDSGNNRVLEYFSPLTTDTRADRVFGQDGSFTTDGCDQNGLDSADLCLSGEPGRFSSAKAATAKMRFQDDGGAALDPAGNLYVADSGNNRVLIFLGATPTPTPSAAPTSTPTPTPTLSPTATPSAKPTATPTAKPTATPTAKPTATPTAKPSATPTAKPSATPTAKPSATPTAKPSATPTAKPSATPTAKPSATPTAKPSATPTAKPTPTASGKPSATATAIRSVSRGLKATATPTPATTLATPKRARLRRLLRRLLGELRR